MKSHASRDRILKNLYKSQDENFYGDLAEEVMGSNNDEDVS